jgi:hypothetical protein
MNLLPFTKFDKTTGEILETGYMEATHISTGTNVIFENSNPETQYFDTKSQCIVDKPIKPDGYYKFNYSSKFWELDLVGIEDAVRYTRSRLLSASDWSDTASAPERMGQELYNAWQSYRQALRDITKQSSFPFEVVWPTPP